MEREDIELLFKEFSGRLHYGLIVSPVDCGKARLIGCLLDSVLLQDIRTGKDYDKPWDIEYVKPYLRPLSDMTEEEIIEINSMGLAYWTTMINNDLRTRGPMSLLDAIITHHKMVKLIDWLNAHHFDYRGLIPKGLAIGVTPDNNPYES